MSPSDIIDVVLNNAWGLAMAILLLGFSIFIHELGHFLAARKRGLKVDRFSIGFGPPIFRWKRNGVDYRISIIPLGGYVAIPQLADMGPIEGESEIKKEELPPVSYFDKVIVFVMGAVFNLIFAFVLSLILWKVGVESTQSLESNTVAYPKWLDEKKTEPGAARKAGVKSGDTIIAIDGITVNNMKQIMQVVAAGTGRTEDGKPMSTLTILRDGKEQEIVVYPRLVLHNERSQEYFRMIDIDFGDQVQVGAIGKGSPAMKAGLELNDIIRSVNGVPVYSVQNVVDLFEKHVDKTVTFEIERKGQAMSLTLTPQNIPIQKPELKLEVEDVPGAYITLVPMYEKNKINLSDQGKADTIAKSIQLRTYSTPGQKLFLDPSIQSKVVAINGKRPKSLKEAMELVQANKEKLTIRFESDTKAHTAIINQTVNTKMIEAKTRLLVGFIDLEQRVIVYQAPSELFYNQIRMLATILKGLVHPESDIKTKNMSGVVTIVRKIKESVDIGYRQVMWFIAFLNINLAVLNLLPIPVLDGGHIAFATIEKLRGKATPFRVQAGIQSMFMLLLLSFMMYVIFFDVLRWRGDSEAEDSQIIKYTEKLMLSTEPFEYISINDKES